MPRDGFETTLRLERRVGVVVVEALGRRGRVLGRTAPAAVR